MLDVIALVTALTISTLRLLQNALALAMHHMATVPLPLRFLAVCALLLAAILGGIGLANLRSVRR